jgi:hypothetical protein
MAKNLLIFLLGLIIISGCKSGGDKPKGTLEIPVPEEGTEQPKEIAEETMEDMVENLSSPIEMAALIKSLGVPFTKEHLSSTDNIDQYISSSSKAFNLGIFGADLGYLNMYGRTSNVVDYLSVIKSLADDIQVGQFFDFPTLKRLATNNENIDSLIFISVHSFNQIDRYLRENRRGNLSALMIAGVWTEGLYLATQVASESADAALAERIGEQKIILDKLLLILRNYEGTDSFAKKVIKDLEEIQSIYKGVTISYEMGEPEMIEENGQLTIIQNETSIVNITDEQLNKLIDITERKRNKLIKE